MARSVEVSVSLTETKPFALLVDFLEDIEAYARLVEDVDYLRMVDECRAELVEALAERY